MNEQEATAYMEAAVQNPFSGRDFLLTYGTESLSLSADQIDAHWDIAAAVQTALHTESGNVTLNLALNEEYITNQLRQFFDDLGGVYSPSGYWVEGQRPEHFGNANGQILRLNKGSTGIPVDLPDLYDSIALAISAEQFSLDMGEPEEVKSPAPLDLDRIFEQISVIPVNPMLDKETFEVIPGENGYGFDITEVELLLDSSAEGDILSIPLREIPPSVSEEDAWFQDILGYYKTSYTDNENRNQNLRLACDKIDGLVLQPGDVFSYNEALGQRTRSAGYLPAPAYSGTDLVDEIGGGICQVSSTLYLSSLFAELKILERKNHGFPANYIPLGLDATVNWGTTDLKLRNDYDYPVKIVAEVSDGYVRVWIMGVDLRDYYVKMEYRVDDHPTYAAAYRCRYDLETDELISRVLDHTSIYLEDVWCLPGFAENAVDEP